MIDNFSDSSDEVVKELDLFGGWTDDKKGSSKIYGSNNFFWNGV